MRYLPLLVILAACGGDSTASPDDDGDAPGLDAGPEEPFRRCTGRALAPLPVEPWRHTKQSPLIVAAGEANHSAQDVIAVPDGARVLVGKFAYGVISKDLEDEDVAIFLDTCGDDWLALGRATTDSDGRVQKAIPDALGPGVYEVRFQVLGDQTTTASTFWVLPVGTRIVVTDIDGTMTQSDAELFMQIFDGSHVPVAYPGAVALTEAHAGLGHVVFYLTGRPYWLTQRTRDWLRDLDFVPGPLHVTDSNEEALPAESGVGDFKKAWIAGLLAAGYQIDFAYGNATTDVYAYLGAGLPPEDVWIIGENAGSMGTQAADGTWEPRVEEVLALPAVEQPFSE
jgi:hypothetical protein